MKICCLLLLFLSITITGPLIAQSKNNYTVRGSVVDSVTGKALAFVTISLSSAAGKAVKTVLSTEQGVFTMEKIPTGTYSLSILVLGYKPQRLPLTLTDSTALQKNMGAITMTVQSKQLKEVLVSANRPLVKQELDRLIYDVQADPESKGENTLEIMRKVPLLSLDADDNVQLKGNSDFKILVNGRPSGLMARNPREALRSMPALNVERIEVITTPPARYDGEGLAGIINIITSKKFDGYTVGLGTYYNSLMGYGAWSTFSVKSSKIAVTGGLSDYVGDPPLARFTDQRQGLSIARSRVEQGGGNQNSYNTVLANTELIYEIDSLNLFTGSIGISLDDNQLEGSNSFRIFDQGNALSRSYRLINNRDGDNNGIDASLNYEHSFKRKGEVLTASFNLNNFDNKQKYLSNAVDRFNYMDKGLRQDNKSGAKEHTYQLDYVLPIRKVNLEAGVKLIERDNYSDFWSAGLDPLSGELIDGDKTTNTFDYKQKVYGLYNSYQFPISKNTGARLGMRIERTAIDADFITLNSSLNTDYTSFIPSVSFQQKLTGGQSLNFGYSQRIQRPGIWQLNPFVNKSNPLFYTSGNADLDPVLNRNIDLSYSRFRKASVIIGLNYSFAHNTIQNIVTLGADSISRSTYANVGKIDNLGLNLNFKYPVTKKLNFDFNARSQYIWTEGTVDGRSQSNDGLQAVTNSTLSYKTGGWVAAVNVITNSPRYTLQGKSSGYYFSALSVNKDLFNKKANMRISLRNPQQKFRNIKTLTSSDAFTQELVNSNYARGIYMNFYYSFGKLKEKIKRNKRGVKNDDVKNGSDETPVN